MKALVVHPGTQHSFRLATELGRRDALAAFYTSVAIVPGKTFDRAVSFLPERVRRRLANRYLSDVPSHRVCSWPLPELIAILRRRFGDDGQLAWHRRAAAFQDSLPKSLLNEASAVIGFDTACWTLGEKCQKLGMPFVVDQSTVHPDAKKDLYRLANTQYPLWNSSAEARKPEVRTAEQKEHDCAARVIAASSFTRQTLIEHGVDASKIRVNPYGVDCEQFGLREPRCGQPIRFLYVGLLNARKGLPLLLEVWRRLSTESAELWIVGHAPKEVIALLPEMRGMRYFGAVPHDEVHRYMQQCDVFVFPSYFEGFGLVLLEAMSSGLPVITTTTTAGPDVLSEGETGWIIEPGNLAQLEERMTYCLDHPREVREMSGAARATAEQYTWTAYGDRWLQILQEVCN